MTVLISTPPANPAISLNLVKEHLRIIGGQDNAALDLYIESAIERFQELTHRALITQTIEQRFDCFPKEDFFYLERGTPFQSLTSFQYYDEDDVLTTVPASDYYVVSSENPTSIVLKNGKTWPSDINKNRRHAVKLVYIAGYGDTQDAIPMSILHCLSMMVADSFYFREDTLYSPGGTVAKPSTTSQNLLNRFLTGFYEHRSQSRGS